MNIKSYSSQKGLSLIELMIAMVLGLFITGTLIQLFVSSKQMYRVQDNVSRLQENGRFAMNFLTRDLRMADFWGCVDSANIESNLNPNSIYDNFNTAVVGTNNDGPNNSDSITIGGASASGIYVVQIPASASADLKVTDNSGLRKDEVVIVSDCLHGDIFQITNDPATGGMLGSDNVVHNTATVTIPGNADQQFQKVYSTDAQIYRLKSVNYSLAEGKNGQNALFRKINGSPAQALIEGIESMHIRYGEDTDGDGTPNYYVPADTPGLNMNNVVSIRVSLVVASTEDNLVTEPMTYSVFGTSYTSNDRRVRRVFTSTIAIRNRLL